MRSPLKNDSATCLLALAVCAGLVFPCHVRAGAGGPESDTKIVAKGHLESDAVTALLLETLEAAAEELAVRLAADYTGAAAAVGKITGAGDMHTEVESMLVKVFSSAGMETRTMQSAGDDAAAADFMVNGRIIISGTPGEKKTIGGLSENTTEITVKLTAVEPDAGEPVLECEKQGVVFYSDGEKFPSGAGRVVRVDSGGDPRVTVAEYPGGAVLFTARGGAGLKDVNAEWFEYSPADRPDVFILSVDKEEIPGVFRTGFLTAKDTAGKINFTKYSLGAPPAAGKIIMLPAKNLRMLTPRSLISPPAGLPPVPAAPPPPSLPDRLPVIVPEAGTGIWTTDEETIEVPSFTPADPETSTPSGENTGPGFILGEPDGE